MGKIFDLLEWCSPWLMFAILAGMLCLVGFSDPPKEPAEKRLIADTWIAWKNYRDNNCVEKKVIRHSVIEDGFVRDRSSQVYECEGKEIIISLETKQAGLSCISVAHCPVQLDQIPKWRP